MRSTPVTAESLLPGWIPILLFAPVAALTCTAVPLAAYALSLAAFGLAHVLVELRYVDGRFGARLADRHGVLVLAVLGLAVLTRTITWQGSIDPMGGLLLELGLVALLALTTLPHLGASRLALLTAVLVAAAIAAGSALAPLQTIVVLAVLHNFTPIGFLAERLGPGARTWRFVAVMLVLFLLVPVAIAAGATTQGLLALGWERSSGALPGVGTLAQHQGVFVPATWWEGDAAVRIFSAVTYLQWLHYATVLGVLPRALGPREQPGNQPRLPWPGARALAVLVALISAAAAWSFATDFSGARAAYGVPAALHAWIEIPLLLIALGLDPKRTQRKPQAAA